MPTKAELEAELKELRRRESARSTIRDSSPDEGGRLTTVGIVCVVMMSSLLIVVLLSVSVYAVLRFTESKESAPEPGPNRDVAELVREIRSAGVTTEDAVYFQRVFVAMADAIQADAEVDPPVFDQRSEIVDVLGAAGSLATAGNRTGAYKGLPDVIEAAFDGVFETDEDGNAKGGPFTESDRTSVVDRYRKLADAFAESSE